MRFNILGAVPKEFPLISLCQTKKLVTSPALLSSFLPMCSISTFLSLCIPIVVWFPVTFLSSLLGNPSCSFLRISRLSKRAYSFLFGQDRFFNERFWSSFYLTNIFFTWMGLPVGSILELVQFLCHRVSDSDPNTGDNSFSLLQLVYNLLLQDFLFLLCSQHLQLSQKQSSCVSLSENSKNLWRINRNFLEWESTK
jgi:hypothetical protein